MFFKNLQCSAIHFTPAVLFSKELEGNSAQRNIDPKLKKTQLKLLLTSKHEKRVDSSQRCI